ncbi:Pyruvate kinase [Ignavibacterium album JCM 16511]|uniref:Pyruvate kinase n=1 Tax=Ignavibacterium album (strain DSM 19864 / JCM 16511 / NBRC 101810 / Mat9-16) TaxID=945713 RepID=I0AH58_IGNAJ|nr:pyruvate kinase [Ignavibacterium album]AFH48315.1 Pyruvate kinase [Ignavibacterium album JCM 16511]
MPEAVEHIAKTKILATLGPATATVEQIKNLIYAGVDGIRLNFSHGDFNFFEEIFRNIYLACVEEKTPLAVLIDLQGPKIRIGELEEPEIPVKENDTIEITTEKVIGTKEKISTTYKYLPRDAEVGNLILIDDGLIRLSIIEKTENSVICKVLNNGTLKSRKGMNLPGMNLSTPSITEKDYENLEFALKHRVDFIALSFVRSAEDVIELKNWLLMKGKEIPVIAKIEKKEAVEQIDEILKIADGIMIARGDLGVELQPQEVPVLQKSIIRKCNCAGKMVITATQMLESMINSPIPTRAEASDVANAVWDGTDVVMLSGETSVGKFPVRTVQIMNDILKKAEENSFVKKDIDFLIPESLQEKLFDSVGRAVVSISHQTNAQAIVVFTEKGRTARLISKYRPKAKIIAVSNNFETMNNLSLHWGVIPIFSEKIDKEHIAIEEAKSSILNSGLAKAGELLIFTAGAPYSEKSRTNWIRFEVM